MYFLPTNGVKMQRFHIFLPEDNLAKVRKAAGKLGISVSELIRRAVQEYLRSTKG